MSVLYISILSAIFILGYFLITVAEKVNLPKAYTAPFIGVLLWFIIAYYEGNTKAGPAMETLGGNVFGLVMFLVSAMALVQILTHYRFFDFIKAKILGLGLGYIKRFWVIGIVTFILSAIIDNMTASLVIVSIALCIVYGKNLDLTAVGIVVAANAGGAATPIGDITTFMLWDAKKFTTGEILHWGLLPSITMFAVSMALLAWQMEKEKTAVIIEENVPISYSEWCVITVAFLSFGLPLATHGLGLPSFAGLFFGLALTGILIAVFQNFHNWKHKELAKQTFDGLLPERTDAHCTAKFETMLAKIDMETIIFFAGIMLAVGALNHAGILAWLSDALLGKDPALSRLFLGNTFLGILSALVDNIPLTRAAISIIKSTDPAIWALLAYTVGTGGSIFTIGSAAGVVTSGKVKMSFYRYAKLGALPALTGYVAGALVWLGEWYVFPILFK